MSFMIKVFCPTAGAVVWANRSHRYKTDPNGRCTKCGAMHGPVKG
jgi:hypothetical protein